ncbi:50S ribosomal protein L25/general stress protein Ctc [Sporosarcina pasteurii]|uniref:Large ribosomal subunit protein bL25 n=1 Tax=Sporosarcina pasteurii TaxID=1474 RepID=A0A380BCU5_SPOPA|nr:50S ribosomal protein L25/general stress protein Ctc [Sporosarcina pasteurii]MDS9473292.1 50S ribosomal protein L25/general stress protein Ctc [Sporosarcina pasteurii]QBQ06522.1 50S ribosomal protein L25/general stress protein Ctc [Sporosarcina pasteurii]SUI98258.1 General stress protein CTC [Sporosarcina pasteurii]
MSTTIQSDLRVAEKQSTLTELRNKGFVPAVVYGYKTDATSISVSERDLIKTLRVTGRNGVMQLLLGEDKLNVVLNDYQADALKGTITHADFLEIDMAEELEVSVQINLVGESVGEKDGGIVQQPNWEIDIKVKPSDIPETFDIDITELNIGETITVADIREKSKYEILSEDDFALVTVTAPRSEEELEALDEVTEEASAEPEVIGEKEEE